MTPRRISGWTSFVLMFLACFATDAMAAGLAPEKEVPPETIDPPEDLSDENKAKAKTLLPQIERAKQKLEEVKATHEEFEKVIEPLIKAKDEAEKKIQKKSALLNQLDKLKSDAKSKNEQNAAKAKAQLAKYNGIIKEINEQIGDKYSSRYIKNYRAANRKLGTIQKRKADSLKELKNRGLSGDAYKEATKSVDKAFEGQIEDAQKEVKDAQEDLKEQDEKFVRKAAEALAQRSRERKQLADAVAEAERKLSNLRSQLSIAYGLLTTEQMLQQGGQVDVEALFNTKTADTDWLDEEAMLVQALGNEGYDNLAQQYLSIIKDGTDLEGKPLSMDHKNYLDKMAAQLIASRVKRVDAMSEKLELSEDAIKLYKNVLASLKEGSALHDEATVGLVDIYFDLADHIGRIALREARVLGVGYRPPSVTNLAAVRKAQPDFDEAGEEIEGSLERNQRKLDEEIRRLKEQQEKALKEYNERLKEEDEARKAGEMTPKMWNDRALRMASKYYKDGMEKARPLWEKWMGIYDTLVWEFVDAREMEDQARMQELLKPLNIIAPKKVDLQHKMELAYATWPGYYGLLNSDRVEVAKQAINMLGMNMEDYMSVWPADKQHYSYWMVMESYVPVDMWAKDWEGKPRPRVMPIPEDEGLTEEEIAYEKTNLERFFYPSDRIQKIFEWYIHAGVDGPVGDDFVQKWRIRALFYQAMALSNCTKLHFALAEAEPDPQKKEQLLAYAREVQAVAEKWIAEAAKPSSIIGEVPEVIRFKTLLEIGVDYSLFMAERAKKAGDMEEAGEWVDKALEQCTPVQNSSNGAWRETAKIYLVNITKFGEKEGLEVGQGVGLILAKAEETLRDAYTTRDPRKSHELFREAGDLYQDALDRVRNYGDKTRRDSVLPKALYNLGICAIKTEQYRLAYLANHAITREFRPTAYPPDIYGGAKKYYPKAAAHLQYAAFSKMNQSNDRFDQELYVQALQENVYANPSEDGTEYVQLINTLKSMGEYEAATEFIESVPKDNPYFRITKLMAAGIHKTLMDRAVRKLERAEEKLAPPEEEDEKKKPLSEEERQELEKKAETLKGEIAKQRRAAKGYAKLFIKLHMEALKQWQEDEANGILVSDAIKNVRGQERKNLLNAMLIPISLAMAEGKYAEAIPLCRQFIQQVPEQTSVPETDRKTFLAQGYWLQVVSQYELVDYEKDEFAKAEENLKATAAIRDKLVAADEERQFFSDSALMLGNGYMTLANRTARQLKQLKAEGEPTAAVEQQDAKYRRQAVDLFALAEEVIYLKPSLAVLIGKTYTDQELYERAENVLRRVIHFWSESLFTPDSLMQGKKTFDDLKSAEVNDVVKDNAGVFGPGKVTGAENVEVAVAALNAMIQSTEYEKNKDALRGMQAALEEFYFNQPEELARVEEAKRLMDWIDIAGADAELGEHRHRLNRILVEFVFPQVLFRTEPLPLMPPRPAYDKIVKALSTSTAYRDDEGRKKQALLLAMMQPKEIKGRRLGNIIFGKTIGKEHQPGYKDELEASFENATDQNTKQRLALILQGLKMPLEDLLYGRPNPKTGQIEMRDYNRAAQAVKMLINVDRNILPTAGVDLPIKKDLKQLLEALELQATLLLAKKSYARSMVMNGKFEQALAYVQTMAEFFPDDPSIKLDLGRVLTAMAAGDRANPRPYDAKAAQLFMEARFTIIDIINRSKPGSEVYWLGWNESFYNQTQEVLSRNRSGEAGKERPEFEIEQVHRGKTMKVKRTAPDYIRQGDKLIIDIERTLALDNPPPPPWLVEDIEDYKAQLNEVGFPTEEAQKKSAEAKALLEKVSDEPIEDKLKMRREAEERAREAAEDGEGDAADEIGETGAEKPAVGADEAGGDIVTEEDAADAADEAADEGPEADEDEADEIEEAEEAPAPGA